MSLAVTGTPTGVVAVPNRGGLVAKSAQVACENREHTQVRVAVGPRLAADHWLVDPPCMHSNSEAHLRGWAGVHPLQEPRQECQREVAAAEAVRLLLDGQGEVAGEDG